MNLAPDLSFNFLFIGSAICCDPNWHVVLRIRRHRDAGKSPGSTQCWWQCALFQEIDRSLLLKSAVGDSQIEVAGMFVGSFELNP